MAAVFELNFWEYMTKNIPIRITVYNKVTTFIIQNNTCVISIGLISKFETNKLQI
jgi:hypothetical protein